MKLSTTLSLFAAIFFALFSPAQAQDVNIFFGMKSKPSPSAGDEVQLSWFEDRGYTIDMWDNSEISSAPDLALEAANAADLVYISESISSGRMRQIESTPTPMILSEQFAADVFGWFREDDPEFDDAHGSPTAINGDGFAIAAGSSFGTSIAIVDDAHPIAVAAGLTNGDHAVYSGGGGRLSWVDVAKEDAPVDSFDVVALLSDYDDTHPTAAALFVVEAGAPIDPFNTSLYPTLEDPNAEEPLTESPGMRIFNFLSDTNRGPEDDITIAGGLTESDGSGAAHEATLLTDAGTALMMASIDYALGLTTTPTVDGDFDNDGDYDGADIDSLVFEIAAGTNGAAFDLDGDGSVNLSDRDAWLTAGGAAVLASKNPFPLGDQDLNGKVDSSDLGLMLNNFGATEGIAYTGGDLNADSNVDSTDLGLLLNGFGQSAASGAVAVPEPNAISLVMLALLAFVCRVRNRR